MGRVPVIGVVIGVIAAVIIGGFIVGHGRKAQRPVEGPPPAPPAAPGPAAQRPPSTRSTARPPRPAARSAEPPRPPADPIRTLVDVLSDPAIESNTRLHQPKFERDAAGALKAWRGNNAEAYPFVGADGVQRVARFALTGGADANGRARYRSIAALPEERRNELGLVPTELVSEAVDLGGGNVLDAVVMSRVPGESLAAHVLAHADDTIRMSRLADNFARRISAFDRRQYPFAHGDLQSGNIRVTTSEAVFFIDYDDVWMPGLTPSTGVGYEEYQHPNRMSVSDWGRYMDTFSATLIHAALLCIVNKPELVELASDVCVLFTEYDLRNPGDSELWSELQHVTDRRALASVHQLLQWCQQDGPPAVPFDSDLGVWS
ncbi:hypothetical protein [Aquihabitans sp. McL0605]|uniref:hypothetical protein n=1 Tax=Aquihabitans sp. McL0605 TaxID=3415671 RepID=UPI003CF3648A